MRARTGSPALPAHRQAGFTMVEVMVAILLTAIGTSGIVGLYLVEARASSLSRHNTEATILAQDEVEVLRTALAPASSSTGSQAGLDDKAIVATGGLYTRSWTVTPGTTYDDVVVTVTWTETGADRRVVVHSRRNR